MQKLLTQIYEKSPAFFQNLMVSLYESRADDSSAPLGT